jgi:signal transduction histidine kinase
METLRTPNVVRSRAGAGLVALVLLTTVLATTWLAPAGDAPQTVVRAVGVLVLTATVAAGVLLALHARITGAPTARLAVALAAVAVLGLGAGVVLVRAGSSAGGLVAVGAGLVAAALLAASAAVRLHRAVEEDERASVALRERLEAVEVGLREDRARLHEINATIGGIASAQKLLQGGLPGDRTEALASMIQAEVERLQRLVADRGPARRRSVDLDEVVGQIVLSHLARGRVVLWEPTGLRALGRADDIAEVLNVLLENAAVHGGPDAVTVRVTPEPAGHGVTISVADQGPGIDAALADRVFDWGVGRAGSPGQGIGLHVAAELSHRLGGRLELLPTGPGATFALHLPAAEQEVGAGERVARAS